MLWNGVFMSIDGRPRTPSYPVRLPHVATTLAISAIIMIGLWRLLTSGGAGSLRTTVTPLAALLPVALQLLLGTFVLALAIRHLLRLLGATDADRAAALVFILPAIGMMEASDAMWIAPVVMALAAAIRRHHLAMLAWCGLALGIGAQALLIAPFFIALLINRRVPIRLWPTAPLVAAITFLAISATGSLNSVTGHLPRVDSNDLLLFNAPNIWTIAGILPLDRLPLLGLAFACATGTIAGYIARFSAQSMSDKMVVPVALLATLLTAGLLPGMHERHFLLADILALILALAIRDQASIRIALLVQLGSALAMLGHVADIDVMAKIGAFAMVAATVQLARPLLKPAANDNPLIARTA